MLETLLVIVFGLIPPLLSLWMMHKAQARSRAKLRAAVLSATRQQRSPQLPPSERFYLEGVGYLIGDISCRFNAQSGYLRCAVNPKGPCQDCHYYEPRKLA
ncbi:MAG: hypothetical protein JOZ78_16180 [Chroococcidiopsidaceae cyanobacterium CP_BM_ER_R8_30]|nr:hypothetical protein [Chroococcidiopsidaceae cyanobacterium CP_BM_ER_R8_30]